MHLAQRAYLLVALSAVMAIAAIWSEPGSGGGSWWHVPAGLLLLGLAFERAYVHAHPPQLSIETEARAYLGRTLPVRWVVANAAARPLELQFAPVVPGTFEPLSATRALTLPARGSAALEVSLLPVRLGPAHWPMVPARVRGPLGLAWWNAQLLSTASLLVAPDARTLATQPRGLAAGVRNRRVAGAGSELHQLRAYQRGDPLTRIDWKATARVGSLVTREYSEDQHLDVLIAIDAGRLSRVRCGTLDRLGLYSNLATRFAVLATARDDRFGLVVYAERVLSAMAPARGLAAVSRVRGSLERLQVQLAESDPTAAAVTVRHLLQHRALVVWLTDLDDPGTATQLQRAVRLLAPPHLVMVAGVLSGEVAALATAPAQRWEDPWVALAAREHELRAATQRRLLRYTGVPVVAAPAERLESAVFERYEALRRTRRI
ncbi:MAG: DUF58 domain-containing protein [Gammaproteobacteria bacterium]|nr:DUF58 domain-containing protein [Gammaproteobacteria bacterium]